MDTVAACYGFIVERTRGDHYWTVGSSTVHSDTDTTSAEPHGLSLPCRPAQHIVCEGLNRQRSRDGTRLTRINPFTLPGGVLPLIMVGQEEGKI